jgi:enoyl-CoA hydratase/carnithine racemase
MNNRVTLEIKNNVAYVTMIRIEKFNAFDFDMINALMATAKKIKKDKSIRAVILSGKGKAYCSGLDFPSISKTPKKVLFGFFKRYRGGTNVFQEVAWCWRKLDIPVISVIHGYCYGAGVQLALASDFRFITPDCEFSILEAKWGLIPDMSGTVSLRELIPMDQAKLLTMTGKTISGVEANELNLTTNVSENPMKMAEELVTELITRSPDSVAATKQLFHKTWNVSESEAFSIERKLQFRMLKSKNHKITLKANFKNESPKFVNRK